MDNYLPQPAGICEDRKETQTQNGWHSEKQKHEKKRDQLEPIEAYSSITNIPIKCHNI